MDKLDIYDIITKKFHPLKKKVVSKSFSFTEKAYAGLTELAEYMGAKSLNEALNELLETISDLHNEKEC